MCDDAATIFRVEWAQLVVPIAAGVVIGFVSGLLSHVFVTARSLRADLALDLEILDRLKDDARPDNARPKEMLSREVTRRMYLLVSYTKFPPLLRSDVYLVVGLVSFFGLAMTVAVGVGDSSTKATLVLVGVLSLLAAACWYSSFPGWAIRARDRLSFIVSHTTSPGDLKDLIAGLNLARFFATVGGAILVGAPLNVAIARLSDGEDWAAAGITALIFADLALLIGAFLVGMQVDAFNKVMEKALMDRLARRRASDSTDDEAQP